MRVFLLRANDEVVIDDDAVTDDGRVCINDDAPQHQLALDMRTEKAETAAEASARSLERAPDACQGINAEMSTDHCSLTSERIGAGAAKDADAADVEVTGDLGRDQADAAAQDRKLSRGALDTHVAFDFDTLGIDGELLVLLMLVSAVAAAIWSAPVVAGRYTDAFDDEVAANVGCLERDEGEVAELARWRGGGGS